MTTSLLHGGAVAAALPHLSAAATAPPSPGGMPTSWGTSPVDIATRALERHGKVPMPFQVEGARWLAARERALLADEAGVGKTLQVLMALPAPCPPTVVVCPAIAKGTWHDEILGARPDVRPAILSGRSSFRWPAPGEILVLNYDILPPALPAGRPPDMVVVFDEAHLCKGTSKRSRRAHALADAGSRCWLVTASPLMNDPLELWNVLSLGRLTFEAFGGSWAEYVALWGGFRAGHGYVWGRPNTARLVGALRRVSLRRRRADVLPQLPAKTFRTTRVGIDDVARSACDRVVEALAAAGLTVGDLARAEARSYEVAFETMSAATAALAMAKIPALLERVEDCEAKDDPPVVFSAHRAPVDVLARRPGWAALTGDTSPRCRADVVQSFQRGGLRGLAATIQTAGLNLTLTRSAHAIFVDRMWTPERNGQAADRICRIGQMRRPLIEFLVADHPLDERLAEVEIEKMRMFDASVGASAVTEVDVPVEPIEVRVWQAAEVARKANGRVAIAGTLRDMPTSGEHDGYSLVRGRPGTPWEGRQVIVAGGETVGHVNADRRIVFWHWPETPSDWTLAEDLMRRWGHV